MVRGRVVAQVGLRVRALLVLVVIVALVLPGGGLRGRDVVRLVGVVVALAEVDGVGLVQVVGLVAVEVGVGVPARGVLAADAAEPWRINEGNEAEKPFGKLNLGMIFYAPSNE